MTATLEQLTQGNQSLCQDCGDNDCKQILEKPSTSSKPATPADVGQKDRDTLTYANVSRYQTAGRYISSSVSATTFGSCPDGCHCSRDPP